MRKIKKHRGIEELKGRYGLMFVTPWILGIILFFLVPIFQSIAYSFSKMNVTADGVKVEFLGLDHYKEILLADPNYTKWISNSLVNFLYSLPIILLVSLVLALMLNQKFRGRFIFRAIYFLPVIIATGEVMNIIFRTTEKDLAAMGVSETLSTGMVSVEEITNWLNMDAKISMYITTAINEIFNLVWSCGIPTVLFLAGLQSVPTSLYEASKVEGATKWEEFWFITFPMLGRVTLLVGIFVMVELITDKENGVVSTVYAKMHAGIYDSTSAMLWFYFIVAGGIMGLIVFVYNKALLKRWDS